jgi:HK97 family phage prohead protease
VAIQLYKRDAIGPVELRSDDDGPVVLRGYAATFDQWTDLVKTPTRIVREVIRRGAFAKDIAARTDVRALYDHASSNVLGRVSNGSLKLSEDDHGLAVEITLPDTSLGRDVAELVRRGDIQGMSFGFQVRPGGEKTVSREVDGVYVTESELTNLLLIEVSAVLWPAYESTSIELKNRSECFDVADPPVLDPRLVSAIDDLLTFSTQKGIA